MLHKTTPRTKPISEKQLAANRRNAKKSTGPRSDAGRKTVSLNAVKHGLTGHVAVLPKEDIAAHQAFCSELIDEMAPANAMELNLAQAIAQDLWRLNRVHAIENNIFAVGVTEVCPNEDDPDPDHDPAKQLALAGARTFMNHANKFGLLTIYEQRIHRAVHKNRAELRLMQMERRQARQAQLEQIAADQAQAEKTPHESQPNPQSTAAPAPMLINSLRPKTAPNGSVYANDASAPRAGCRTLKKAA